ncbi:MAG: tape measure protein [Prevotella sp.]|nr:tape measure protein [Prevotella sp.]
MAQVKGTLWFDTNITDQALQKADQIRKQLEEKFAKEINVKVNTNVSDLMADLQKSLSTEKFKVNIDVDTVKNQMSQAASQANAKIQSGKLNSKGGLMFSALGKVAGGGLGVYALKELTSKIITVRGEFEQMNVAIKTLVGNEEKAGAILNELKDYAKVSPLEFKDVTKATQTLIGFGVEAEKVPHYLRAIGDVSMGNKERFQRLSLAFAQTAAAGKLLAQDLRQFVSSGFNPLQQISEKTGKSMEQLRDEMRKGAISAEMVQQAFIDATSEGGKFYHMSENANKTVAGQLSNLADSISYAFDEIGEKNQGLIIDGVKFTQALVDNYTKVAKVLAGSVATYGAYRTAVALVTQAEGAHNALQLITQARILATEKAQRFLNATMLNNPYVAAVVALGALATALWAMSDGMDAAERAQATFDKSLEKGKEEQAKFNEETEKAINMAQDDAAASTDRKKALDVLIARYPSIIQRYIDEEGHLKNIVALKKEIALLDGKASVSKLKTESVNSSRAADIAERALNAQRGGTRLSDAEKAQWEKIKKQYFEQTGASKLFTTVEDIRNYFRSLAKNYDREAGTREVQNAINNYVSSIGQQTTASLKVLEKSLQDAKNKSHRSYIKGIGLLNSSQRDNLLSLISGTISARETPRTENKESLSKKKKELQAKLDALSVEEAAGKKGLQIRKQITAINKQLEAYDSKSYARNTKKNEREAAARDREAAANARSAAAEVAKQTALTREEVELQRKLEEAEINAMEEGSEKRLAKMQLSHRKELDEIEREKEDFLKKKRDAAKATALAKGEAAFDVTSVVLSGSEKSSFEKWRESVLAKQKRELRDLRGEELLRYTESIREYGTYSQKIIAIANERAEKIRKANGDGSIIQAANRKASEEMASLYFERLKENINWDVVFGNLDTYTKETLINVRKQLKEYLRMNRSKMNVKDIREVQTALNNLNGAINEQSGIFTAVKNAAEGLAEAEKDLLSVQVDYTQAVEMFGEDSAQAEAAAKRLNEAQNGVIVAQGSLNTAQNGAVDKVAAISNAMAALGKTSKASMSEVGNAVGAIVSAFGKSGSKVGTIISAIFTLLDSIGERGIGNFASNIVGSVGNALIGLNEWNPFNHIFSDNTFLGQFFGAELLRPADYRDYNEALAQYNNLIGVWDILIDRKNDYLSKSWGAEANRAAKEAREILEAQIEATKVIASERLGAGTSVGSHSIGYRMWEGSYDYNGQNWQDVAKEAVKGMKAAGLGDVVFESMEDMTRMTSKQLEYLMTNYSGLWAMMDGDFKEYLEKLIEYYDKAEEQTDQLKEKLTGFTGTSLADAWAGTISDMSKKSEDLYNNLEEGLRGAIINAMVGNIYSGEMKNLVNGLADAAQNELYTDVAGNVKKHTYDTEGNILDTDVLSEYTQEEYNNMRAVAENLAEREAASRDLLADLYGWEDDGATSSASQVLSGLSESDQGLFMSYVNAIRGDLSINRANVDLICQQLAESMPSFGQTIAEHSIMLRDIADNTLRNANSNDEILKLVKGFSDGDYTLRVR